MFRSLILDWSGTLVDDMAPTLDATNVVLERFGKAAMSQEEFRARFRLPYSEFYDEVLPGVPLEVLEGHFREAFSGSDHAVKPLEGTREFLEWCAHNAVRLFVLTSMDATEFGQQLRAFGFEDYFEHTYAGVLDKRLVIHEILRTHGLRAEETGYVGDMVHDIETARHGGVTSVGVLSGYDPVGRLSAAEPKLLLACVKSLHAMLKHAADRPSEPSREGETDERIEIRRLEVSARVGVPEEERAEPQRLLVSLELIPEAPFGDLHDEISRTVDYYQVARRVRTLVAERPRKLIETLASEIAEAILDGFATRQVTVTIEKFILPDTECVAVRTTRRR
jgi:phosphoglycolate phosphatase